MVRVCAVPIWHSRSDVVPVVYHSLPKDEKTTEKWVANVCRISWGAPCLWKPTKNSRICGKHFQDQWYVTGIKKKLIPTAVPTLGMGNTSSLDLMYPDPLPPTFHSSFGSDSTSQLPPHESWSQAGSLHSAKDGDNVNMVYCTRWKEWKLQPSQLNFPREIDFIEILITPESFIWNEAVCCRPCSHHKEKRAMHGRS